MQISQASADGCPLKSDLILSSLVLVRQQVESVSRCVWGIKRKVSPFHISPPIVRCLHIKGSVDSIHVR